MPTHIEQLSNRRIYIVTLMALTYLFLQIFSLDFVGHLTGWSEAWLNRLEDIAGLAFAASLIAFGLLVRRVKRTSPDAKQEFYDELVKHNKQQAMVFSFKVLFVLSAGLFVLCQFITMTGEDVSRLVMTAGLVVLYLSFAYLERRNA